MLPDNLFVNLLDIDLQNRIAEAKNYDFDIKQIMEDLLAKGPATIRKIGKLNNDQTTLRFCSIKIRTTYPMINPYNETSWHPTMT